jgi:AraC family transcriptional regulator of adaptative response/methylated-DNA-[protein]-cysteine methyltransferase
MLPLRRELLRAITRRDASYEGVFVTGVRTTGIFCRPTCPARRPRPENIEFYASCDAALTAGYRPCKRCSPLAPLGHTPPWLEGLVSAVERDPARRWRDADLRGLGVEPARVSRWFKTHHGMTFHAYSRARRLSQALRRIQGGGRVTAAAYQAGYESLSGFNDAFQKFAGHAPTALQDAPVVHVTRIETPLGPMVAAATETHLLLLEFADRRMLATQVARLARALHCVFAPGASPIVRALDVQLAEYFRGERRAFDVPIETPGTAFQRQVWEALRRIPAGSTRSYADIARAIGRPRAVRAVARANGDNRIAILIPCHRVIGSRGDLVGYGGGVWRKRRLLDVERSSAG